MSEELKACPFCGREAQVRGEKGWSDIIRCSDDGANCPLSRVWIHPDDWNRRTPSPAPAPEFVALGIIAEITAERERQKSVEGWTEAHDDEHTNSEMARAAASYALPTWARDLSGHHPHGCLWPVGWEFKPKDTRRDLVRAAALVVAEIERLDRLAAAERALKGGERG